MAPAGMDDRMAAPHERSGSSGNQCTTTRFTLSPRVAQQIQHGAGRDGMTGWQRHMSVVVARGTSVRPRGSRFLRTWHHRSNMAPAGMFLDAGQILSRRIIILQQLTKRFRVKKKWASTRKSKSASELALNHFDNYYSPVYRKRWSSMRVALLSQSKYCALANNFCELENLTSSFEPGVLEDIVEIARNTLPSEGKNRNLSDLSARNPPRDKKGKDIPKPESTSDYYVSALGERLEYDSTDIYQYMPVQRVLSEEDELLEREQTQSMYEPQDVNVPIVQDLSLNLPQHLKAYCYEKGDVQLFPAPSTDDNGILGYYMMDAASILPVIALGLTPGDNVLDLCAAPGGKSLTMIQTLMPENIVCVDHSYSRLGRLMDVIQWYAPKFYTSEKKVQIVHDNAVRYCKRETRRFDKILVDVPCYTDRHVVGVDENNIFRRSRISDRLKIQDLQHNILLSAVTLLKPGGTLVYSTCTLSMPQNDGTVQSVLEKLWQQTNIDMSVVDTAPLVDRFRDVFHFYDGCRLGQLVLPNLTANFGPSYFCKLRRNN